MAARFCTPKKGVCCRRGPGTLALFRTLKNPPYAPCLQPKARQLLLLAPPVEGGILATYQLGDVLGPSNSFSSPARPLPSCRTSPRSRS